MIGLLHKILVKYHGTAFFIIILPYIPKTIRFFIIITFNIYENIILLVGLINANVIQSLTIKYQLILRSILNRNTIPQHLNAPLISSPSISPHAFFTQSVTVAYDGLLIRPAGVNTTNDAVYM